MPARLGFVGLGWIGRTRLEAVAAAGAAHVAAICDPDTDRLAEAARSHPGAAPFEDDCDLYDAAGELGLDGVVLATPNGLHCAQSLNALERGLAVFVQKPMATDADDVGRMLERARQVDRSIEVDYSYRGLLAARELRQRIRAGDLGDVFLIDAAFHNAWGPDKPWCYDRALSGGGCLLDLGVHLVDLTMYVTDGLELNGADGWTRDLAEHPGIDGFAAASFELGDGPRVRLATSWHAHTGRDCEFRLEVSGSAGSAVIRNVDGSFYDFELIVRHGRGETTVSCESRTWMDRVVVEWAEHMARDASWNERAMTNLAIGRLVDSVYAGSPLSAPA